MIDVHAARRIWLYSQPDDLRKGFGGLYAIANSTLGVDPVDGALFIFLNRRRFSAQGPAMGWHRTLCLLQANREGTIPKHLRPSPVLRDPLSASARETHSRRAKHPLTQICSG